MTEYLAILAIALLPVTGNLLGSLLAESVRTPQWIVGVALHGAAGIAIAVVSIDLMPRILGDTNIWVFLIAFAAGACLSALIARAVDAMLSRFGDSKSTVRFAGAWMVYVAVAADLFSDGLMTGAGSAISRQLGFVLALSQFVANIPGGFATTANFRIKNVRRSTRLLVAFSFFIPVILAASLGFWFLKGAQLETQNAALVFIVGILLLATVEDTLPQGDHPSPPRAWSTFAFGAGFGLFALLSSYLG